jgi:hypothetical protein
MSTETLTPGRVARVTETLRNVDPLHVVEAVVTVAALTAVAVKVGPVVGVQLGASGPWELPAGLLIALAMDLVWLGCMRKFHHGLRQRDTKGAVVMGAASVLAVAASTLLMIRLGHAESLAYLPGAALVATAIRVYADERFADRVTVDAIADRTATDRNAMAEADAEARHIAAEADADARKQVAREHAASLAALAVAEQRAAGQVALDERLAALEAELTASDEQHGKAVKAFRKRALRGTVTAELPALPVTPDETVTAELERIVTPTVTAELEPTVTSLVAPSVTVDPKPAVTVPVKVPALDDAERYAAGVKVWKSLPDPVSQAAFIRAARDAGIKGSQARMTALYKAVKADLGEAAAA